MSELRKEIRIIFTQKTLDRFYPGIEPQTSCSEATALTTKPPCYNAYLLTSKNKAPDLPDYNPGQEEELTKSW